MINKEQLQILSELTDKQEEVNYDELAENLDILEKANAKLHSLLITARMRKIMLEFGERETDIYVVTFPKSGTTLMQMIIYQLTTDGNMDFNHLYEVSPWCRFYAFFNREMPSVGEQRIIKTHDAYPMFAHIKKGRFIFLIRDCLDVIASFYQHIKDYNDPNVNFSDLSNRKMKEWFSYNVEWIQNKKGLEIPYVNYEDLIANKNEVVLKIAQFLRIEINDLMMARVLQKTSFEFMKQHESKFGEQPEYWKVYTNFIRNGKVGEGKVQFTAEQLENYRNLSEAYQLESTYLKRYFV